MNSATTEPTNAEPTNSTDWITSHTCHVLFDRPVIPPNTGNAIRMCAGSAHADTWHTDIEYTNTDVLLFGPEPTGLEQSVLDDSRITQLIRIPMLPARRSMNLSNAAAVAAYEVWRQQGFMGGK